MCVTWEQKRDCWKEGGDETAMSIKKEITRKRKDVYLHRNVAVKQTHFSVC